MRNVPKTVIKAPLIVVTLSIGLSVSASDFAAAEMKDAQEAFVRADYHEAYRQSLPEADRGNVAAQSMIGSLYAHGRGVPKDDFKAFHWFKRAADQGDPSAQYAVSKLYEAGRGVEQDIQAAVHWLTKAAESGLSVAQLSLAHHYREGVGVPQDREQASYWQTKSEQDPANGIIEGTLDRIDEE